MCIKGSPSKGGETFLFSFSFKTRTYVDGYGESLPIDQTYHLIFCLYHIIPNLGDYLPGLNYAF